MATRGVPPEQCPGRFHQDEAVGISPRGLPRALDLGGLLEPFAHRGVSLGLSRLKQALPALGHPEQCFPAVQIAGTNGKGSICTLLAAVLTAAGVRVGVYTSPHLVSWRERIRVGPSWIPANRLRQLLLQVNAAAAEARLTPFEALTAVAFRHFAEQGVELAILEVGLGGRLDATTSHPDRQLIGFASIGMDHCEYLGSDLESIAAEKAAVLQPGSMAVSAAQHPAVEAVLAGVASQASATLRRVEPLALQEGRLLWRNRALHCGLPGQVQRHNGAVALGLLEALGERGWPISTTAIELGFAAARWPGRLQAGRHQGLPLLLDGAHNPAAAAALRAELDRQPGPVDWLVGVLANKDAAAMVSRLLRPQDRLLLLPVPGHACWTRQALLEALAGQGHRVPAGQIREISPDPAAVPAILPRALDLLRQSWGGSGAAVDMTGRRTVVAGSLYLLGNLMADGAVETQP